MDQHLFARLSGATRTYLDRNRESLDLAKRNKGETRVSAEYTHAKPVGPMDTRHRGF